MHDGIPVTAGEMIVHLKDDRVIGANAHTLGELPALTVPGILPAAVIDEARAVLEKHRPAVAAGARYSQPRLEVFNRGMLDEGTFPTRLAWFVEATGEGLREFIWVDAQTGGALLNFSQLQEAKNRTVYDVALGTTLPGTLVRSEAGPASAVTDVNQAYDYAGVTYDYFFSQYGRDSFNGAGAEIRSSVRYRHPSAPGSPYQNAFWNGTQMVYGEGFAAADDVVGHELTHAVIEYSANLLYYNQSGALNESYADIFGETIDQLSSLGGGNDTTGVRWLVAEDLSIGAIRNMMTPTSFGDPGKMSDPQFVCRSDGWTSPTGDSGGVHSNSGVGNHAFALMVDGGSYNGQTIAGIGVAKAARIQYRALITYLTSGSGFLDNSAALNASCTDLVGTAGITPGDCTQVANALVAVEMAKPLRCAGSTPPPATFCPLGGSPVPLFSDGFEAAGASWTPSSTTTNNWNPSDAGFAKGGLRMAYGPDVGVSSDHRLAMTNAVSLPPNARMSFDHAFEFEHWGTTTFYDGGVLEFSTNNGASWNDAGGLIEAGHAYNGTLHPDNALEDGRPAFVRSSFGYTGSRLNLAALAGQSVRFRFRVGTDSSVGSLGWVVDNVLIYTCDNSTGGPQPPTGLVATSILGNNVTFRWTPPASGPAPTGYVIEGGAGSGSVAASILTGSPFPSFSIAVPTGSFHVRVHTLWGASRSPASNEILIHVNVPVPPSAPTNLLGMVNGNTLALAWSNTFVGGAPANIMLDVAGSLTTSLPVGASEGFQFAPMPAGTYTLSVRAANVAGTSPASNSVTLTFPGGCSGAPLAPANLRTNQVGSTIFVSWDLPGNGPAPTGYVLVVTGTFNGAIPTAGRALSGTVGPGTYNISVFAANSCGNGPATAVQTVTIP
jgi:hypothetical protein